MGYDSIDEAIDNLNAKFVAKGYKFIRLIGQGMQTKGGVYYVEKTDAVGIEDIAAKVFTEKPTIAIVKQDLNSWAALKSHDAVIQYKGFDDKTYPGRAVLFMEYCRCADMYKFVSDSINPMQYEDYRNMLDVILGGLHHAHEGVPRVQDAKRISVIHRDLKPDNLLIGYKLDGARKRLTRDDGTFEFIGKIADFGLAKAGEGAKASQTQGAAGYRAPEAHTGGDITRAFDIYSCGIIIDELFSGIMRNGEGEDDGGKSLSSVVALKRDQKNKTVEAMEKEVDDYLKQVVKPDRYVKLGGLPNENAENISAIVQKCLQYNQSDRYRTAEGLRIDVNLAFKPRSDISALEELAKKWPTPEGIEVLLKGLKSVKDGVRADSAAYFNDSVLLKKVMKEFTKHRKTIEMAACTYAARIHASKFSAGEREKALAELLKDDAPAQKPDPEKQREKERVMEYFKSALASPDAAVPKKGALGDWNTLFQKIAAGGELANLFELWMTDMED
jgi:serine/threonine protein kinase